VYEGLAQESYLKFGREYGKVKDHISSLNAKGEDFNLDVEDLEELYSLSANLFSLSKLKTIASNGQQSIMTWLEEEDANSNSRLELSLLGGNPMLSFPYLLMGCKWKVLMVSEGRFSIILLLVFRQVP